MALAGCVRHWLRAVTIAGLAVVIGMPGEIMADDYRLGPGDVLDIVVYDEADLSLQNIRVPSNGRISYPLLGDVEVNNLTAQELEDDLIQRLKQGYLNKPRVSVIVVEYRPFFVNGQVRNPGAYPYVTGLTVRKAIALAGGATERASLRKLSVIHEATDKQVSTKMDAPLQPGDILTIGESLF